MGLVQGRKRKRKRREGKGNFHFLLKERCLEEGVRKDRGKYRAGAAEGGEDGNARAATQIVARHASRTVLCVRSTG